MADDDTTPLPAQAQTGLPGAAENAADITTAPPAADVLGPAAYGDKGWQQYQDLQRAGQQSGQPAPPPVPVPLPGDRNASGLNYLLGGGGAAAPSPLVNLFGGPGTAERAQNVVLQQQQQAQQIQMRKQQIAANGLTFLESMRKQNVPLALRAPMIQQWAAQQGLPIDPIQAAYIAQWGNDPQKYESHLLEQIRGGGPAATDAAHKWEELFSSDYNRMIAASDAARVDKAAADAEVAKATLAQRTAQLGPVGKTAYENAALQAANEGKPRGSDEFNKRVADILNQQKVAETKATTAARTAAGPVPVGTADKLAGYDVALDIIDQLKKMYEKGSPTDQERQSWLNRVKQEVQYKWGFEMPDNLDEDTALRSLGAITAGRAFIQGRPNQQLMTEIWKHTGQNPLVSPDQMRDRLKIMERQVRLSKNSLVNYTKSGRGELEASPAGAGSPGETGAPPEPNAPPTISKPSPSGRISAADFLSQ
jgi:hypothetical protein